MSRTIEIRMGDKLFKVPAFNLRQLREVGRMQTEERQDIPFKLLLLALSRADPPIKTEEELLDLEPKEGEFAEALAQIQKAAGLETKKAATAAGEAKAPAAD